MPGALPPSWGCPLRQCIDDAVVGTPPELHTHLQTDCRIFAWDQDSHNRQFRVSVQCVLSGVASCHYNVHTKFERAAGTWHLQTDMMLQWVDRQEWIEQLSRNQLSVVHKGHSIAVTETCDHPSSREPDSMQSTISCPRHELAVW